jgi:hypothetical protein
VRPGEARCVPTARGDGLERFVVVELVFLVFDLIPDRVSDDSRLGGSPRERCLPSLFLDPI